MRNCFCLICRVISPLSFFMSHFGSTLLSWPIKNIWISQYFCTLSAKGLVFCSAETAVQSPFVTKALWGLSGCAEGHRPCVVCLQQSKLSQLSDTNQFTFPHDLCPYPVETLFPPVRYTLCLLYGWYLILMKSLKCMNNRRKSLTIFNCCVFSSFLLPTPSHLCSPSFVCVMSILDCKLLKAGNWCFSTVCKAPFTTAVLFEISNNNKY